MHADRTNRAAMIVLGLLLVLLGVGGVLLGFGAFGPDLAGRSVTDNPISRFVGDYRFWFWLLAALAGLMLAVVGLSWVTRIAFATDRVGDLVAPGDSSRGRTTIAAGALTRAVVTEVEGYRGVHSASARLIGDDQAPHLVLEVQVEEDADLAAVRRRLETEAVMHCREVTDRPELPVTIDLGVATSHQARVS